MGVNYFDYLVIRAEFLSVDSFLRMTLPPKVQLLLFKISVVLLLMVSMPSMYSLYVSAFICS